MCLFLAAVQMNTARHKLLASFWNLEKETLKRVGPVVARFFLRLVFAALRGLSTEKPGPDLEYEKSKTNICKTPRNQVKFLSLKVLIDLQECSKGKWAPKNIFITVDIAGKVYFCKHTFGSENAMWPILIESDYGTELSFSHCMCNFFVFKQTVATRMNISNSCRGLRHGITLSQLLVVCFEKSAFLEITV